MKSQDIRMRKMYCSLGALLLLLQLTACTGLPGITISQETPVVTITGSQTQGTGEEQQLTQRLFKQINQDRATNNLPLLAWEPRLEKSARQHDLVMAKGCGLMHQCPNEPDLGTRISHQGVQWQTVDQHLYRYPQYTLANRGFRQLAFSNPLVANSLVVFSPTPLTSP